MSPSATTVDINNLRIFTLNCWGLRYVSDHRTARIKLIAQHLSENDYDVVFLQELWIQSDFEYIRTKTKSKYRFAHMYNNASLLGTSGLIIMSRWMPNFIHFYPFSVNGSPFQPCHGDWFSRKGVAYARVELGKMNLHLFCVHMHAQYDTNEKLNDQYSIHRICQAYELGKFVNLMSHSSSSAQSNDLIILAGDLNVSSKELPYKVLMALTALKDCQKLVQNEVRETSPKENDLKTSAEESDSDSDSDCATCGHHSNTFTPKELLKAKVPGKRIDFILFRLTSGAGDDLIIIPEKIPVIAKDESGLSFSDHQPVAFKLALQQKSKKEISNGSARQSSEEAVSPVLARRNNESKNVERRMKYKVCDDPSGKQQLEKVDLVPAVEDLLSSYIEKFQSSFKYISLMVTAVAFLCFLLLLVLKLTLDLTYTEMFLMIVILLMVSIIAGVLKFVTQRTEINAVKAILKDIHRKGSLWDLPHPCLYEEE